MVTCCYDGEDGAEELKSNKNEINKLQTSVLNAISDRHGNSGASDWPAGVSHVFVSEVKLLHKPSLRCSNTQKSDSQSESHL